MSGSVYKVIELVGTSGESWEAAARAALEAAAQTVKDLRVAEVVTMDVRLDENAIAEFRVILERIVQVSRRTARLVLSGGERRITWTGTRCSATSPG